MQKSPSTPNGLPRAGTRGAGTRIFSERSGYIPLALCDDVVALRGMVEALWSLCDDISSASDAAGPNDGAYRETVETMLQRRLRETPIDTDGVSLYVARLAPLKAGV